MPHAGRVTGQGWQGRRGISPCWGCAKERPWLTFRACVLGKLRKQVPSQAALDEDKENGKASAECRKTGQEGAGGWGGGSWVPLPRTPGSQAGWARTSFMTLAIDRAPSPPLPLKGKGQGPHPEQARSASTPRGRLQPHTLTHLLECSAGSASI